MQQQQTEVSSAQSVAMIRNLMRVTFSNVVYTRGIFDPSQFKPMNAPEHVMSGREGVGEKAEPWASHQHETFARHRWAGSSSRHSRPSHPM